MTTIITKNSSTASAVPLAADLVQGELAVNVTDKRLFTQNASDVVVELGTNPSSVTTASATITGGTVNGTSVGASTPSTGAFTTLSASGNVTLGDASTDTLNVGNGGLIKDASGNLGLGVTPSAWSTLTGFDINTWGGIGGYTNQIVVASNAYYNGGWKYKQSNYATRYEQNNTGIHGWYTAPSGTAGAAISFTQAMTLDASGNLLVGTTSTYASKVNVNYAGAGNAYGIGLKPVADNTFPLYFLNAAGSSVGQVYTTTSATAYNTSSDYRLKENIAPMTGALSVVQRLKPCTYNWKADGSDGQGFIAHELQAVVPDCVTGEKDAVDADGKPVYQGIDTSFLVSTLTAAIQELKATVDAQAARITALEQA